MQQRQQQREPPDGSNPADGLRRGYYLALLVFAVWGAPVTMLTRKIGTIGRRFISWHHWAGIAWLAAFPPLAFPGEPTGPSAFLACVTTGLLVVHWLKRDRSAHSRFCGVSGLPGGAAAYRFSEPLTVCLAGVACLYLSVGLGVVDDRGRHLFVPGSRPPGGPRPGGGGRHDRRGN